MDAEDAEGPTSPDILGSGGGSPWAGVDEVRRAWREAERERDVLAREVETVRLRARRAEREAQRLRAVNFRLRRARGLPGEVPEGQRIMRRAFEERARVMANEHARKTAEMLNMQKACFEEELEAIDAEARATCGALEETLLEERDAAAREREAFEKERETALEKAGLTMDAVERKMALLHARATRLEREKTAAVAAGMERQALLEAMSDAAAARDIENRRLDVISRGYDSERVRKNALIDKLQREVNTMRNQLAEEREANRALSAQLCDEETARRDEQNRHSEDLEGCRKQSKGDVDRLGRLFASMIQDLQSADVPTT